MPPYSSNERFQHGDSHANRNVTLTSTSILSILLLIVHVSDDVARWLYGTLPLGDRRSGYVIMLLGSLFGAAASLMHMISGVSRTLTNSPDGALFFVFTLWALAVTATFSAVLAARGLWRREWARVQVTDRSSG